MSAEPSAPTIPWWQISLKETLRDLCTTKEGLTSAQAQLRLQQYGANRIEGAHRRSWLSAILQCLRNPLVLLLLVAGGVSALTGEAVSAGIVATMVLLSVVLDYLQEHRAEDAAERLAKSVAIRAQVVRDGITCERNVEELVPGDVVHLSAGSLIPADGLVLTSKHLFVQQAALTGEPYPAEKRSEAAVVGDGSDGNGADASLSDALGRATNALFMGSSVLSGTATMLLCKTGRATELGRVARAVSSARPMTAFDNGIHQFGYLIMRVTLLLVLFVLLVNGIAHRPWLESFLFSIALAVGLTPELLPMIVTVTLSRGAIRLAKDKVIVKRLAAIQNLGAMDVLCIDKTGTLTEAKITLARHVNVLNEDDEHVLELAYLNSHFETRVRTSLEEAILAHDTINVDDWHKLDEVPFDFERRRLSVLIEKRNDRWLIVKGAPEDVLAHCNRVQVSGAISAWTAESRAAAEATLQLLSADGFRVLGVASKQVATDVESASIADEDQLVFAGFAVFLDPPKTDAGLAISKLSAKHVNVKILTGDSELVTQHVCKAIGIPVKGILLGSEIAALDDSALALHVERVNLFCRVNPIQKNRIVQALQSYGHVVGFMGDGINDAPALHSADVSITVDTAVDVAKAASDLIMMRHDLSMLDCGVREGRRTFGNIRKYIMMGTSSNFGNMFSMAGATLFLPFLPMMPTQILLNNFLYDLSQSALPFDEVDAKDLAAPQHWDTRVLRNFMLIMGPVSSLFDFATFYLLLNMFQANQPLFQTGWFIESLATQTLVILIIRTRGSPWASRPHPGLWIALVGVLAVAVALPFTPIGSIFGFVMLPPAYFIVLAILVVIYLLLAQLVKTVFFRSKLSRPARRKVTR
jgi:P-type Mg2+ transporter